MFSLRSLRLVVMLCFFSSLVPMMAAETQTFDNADQRVPGVALSQGITEITGVAISPLLGVSAVGAYRYWKAPVEQRPMLPWYCQPWAWGTGAVLLTLCFLKDSLGVTVPGVLKKPFDMVELLESKASALVASAAFVPLVIKEMAPQERVAVPTAMLDGLGFVDVSAWWLLVPVGIVAFLAVWLCSHAINVLIILSPFSSVDAVLKLMRAGSLVALGLVYLIAPWLAAALCVAIILVALWLAPAAMRLMIFGTRYAFDVLLPWRGRKRATPESPHVFTFGKLSGLPSRTGGRLVKLEDGSMAFRYRRGLVLDVRTVPIPDGVRHVEKGLLSPSLLLREEGQSDGRKVLLFLPRYRGHEERIVESLELHGVREHALSRGFKAARGWLVEMIRRGRESVSGA